MATRDQVAEAVKPTILSLQQQQHYPQLWSLTPSSGCSAHNLQSTIWTILETGEAPVTPALCTHFPYSHHSRSAHDPSDPEHGKGTCHSGASAGDTSNSSKTSSSKAPMTPKAQTAMTRAPAIPLVETVPILRYSQRQLR